MPLSRMNGFSPPSRSTVESARRASVDLTVMGSQHEPAVDELRVLRPSTTRRMRRARRRARRSSPPAGSDAGLRSAWRFVALPQKTVDRIAGSSLRESTPSSFVKFVGLTGVTRAREVNVAASAFYVRLRDPIVFAQRPRPPAATPDRRSDQRRRTRRLRAAPDRGAPGQ
jgi:hypothetical protein